MPLTKVYRFLICSCLLMSSFCINALEVIFINPGFSNSAHANNNTTGDFWFNVSKIMQNAAADLNITLHTQYANRNHILMKQLILQAIKSKPDYLILVDEKNVTSDYLAKINSQNVPIYYLLNRPSPANIGKLKLSNTNVVGSITPDNRFAGESLIQGLFHKFTRSKNQPANTLALLGDYTTPASLLRTQGLMDFVAKTPNITLTAQEVANWSEREGFTKTMAFMQLAPEINIIWCANDAIAFGAKKALKKLNKESKVIVGGINWDLPAENMPELDISIGGHVLLGAYAMIDLFDNHANKQQWPLSHNSIAIFEQLTNKNRPLFNFIHNRGLAKIDFTKFSKTHTNWHEFTLENLTSELN